MALEPTQNSPSKNLVDLRKEADRLSKENVQYLGELSNGEILKMQLKETRKDAKHLSKQKKRLQAMTDTRAAGEETSEQLWHTSNSQAESQVPLDENLSTSDKPFLELQPPQGFNSAPSREGYLWPVPAQESFPPPPPPQGFSMNGHSSPILPAAPFTKVPRAPEWGTPDASALQIENRNLVRIKRKQEEHINNLVQEVASLGTRYKDMESIAQRLEAENQRLSQRVGQAHYGQVQSYNLRPHEEIELLRAQLKVYEDDFKKERSEREHLNTQKERLKRELQDSQATVAGLQRQLKQALAGEGGYAELRDLPRAPIMNEPYYDTYPPRYPLDYEMARAYSGGYIGPGASNNVHRRGRTPFVKKAFLTPDLTAVVDRDILDGTTKNAPKSI